MNLDGFALLQRVFFHWQKERRISRMKEYWNFDTNWILFHQTFSPLLSWTMRYWYQTLLVNTPGGDFLVVIPSNSSCRVFSLKNRSRDKMDPELVSKERMFEESAWEAGSSKQLNSNSKVIWNSWPSLGIVLIRLSSLTSVPRNWFPRASMEYLNFARF